MKKEIKGVIILTFCSLLWGTTFIAQSDAAETIPACSFLSIRYAIGALLVLPFAIISAKNEFKKSGKKTDKRVLIIGGCVTGLFCFLGSVFQQIGFSDPDMTSWKAAFLTAFYIVLTPVFGLFLKRKVQPAVWISIVIAIVGMYLLCISSGTFSFSYGTAVEIAGALFYSFQILSIDYFLQKTNCLQLACAQFVAVSVISGICAAIFDNTTPDMIIASLGSILYAGILSSGVAYTLQVIGQKYCPPSVAPLVMSLESVFAALSGWLLRDERLTVLQFIGCGMIFFAIVLTQIPFPQRKIKNHMDRL